MFSPASMAHQPSQNNLPFWATAAQGIAANAGKTLPPWIPLDENDDERKNGQNRQGGEPTWNKESGRKDEGEAAGDLANHHTPAENKATGLEANERNEKGGEDGVQLVEHTEPGPWQKFV